MHIHVNSHVKGHSSMKNVQRTIHMWGSLHVEGTLTCVKNVQGTIHIWGKLTCGGEFTYMCEKHTGDYSCVGKLMCRGDIHMYQKCTGGYSYVRGAHVCEKYAGGYSHVCKNCVQKTSVNGVCKNVCRICVKNMCKSGCKNVCENVQRTIHVWGKITCGGASHQSEILHSFIFQSFFFKSDFYKSLTNVRGQDSFEIFITGKSDRSVRSYRYKLQILRIVTSLILQVRVIFDR